MSTETNINAGAAAEAPVKKGRRGISNETQATSQLKFHEKDACPNKLFLGHLHNVSVAWSVNADGKQFAGEKCPRLVFEFCSNTTDVTQMRHVYHSLFPVESNVNTIPGGSEEWKFNQVMNFIKHILDVYYLKGRQLTPDEETALTLPFTDFDDDGNFVSLEIKDILAGYAELFNNVAAMLNGQYGLAEGETAKPCYRDENGRFRKAWIKLLRHKKVKGQWKDVGVNGELAFDSFVGTGVVELWVQGKEPAIISVDDSRESITPKEVKRAPSIPGVVDGMGGAVMAGNVGMMNASGSAYNEAAAGEMPF
mgnify:CR=1 FL=1